MGCFHSLFIKIDRWTEPAGHTGKFKKEYIQAVPLKNMGFFVADNTAAVFFPCREMIAPKQQVEEGKRRVLHVRLHDVVAIGRQFYASPLQGC